MNRVAEHETMSAVDTAWLRMDAPTNRMVANGLMFVGPGLDVERLMLVLDRRLVPHPRFRQRVVEPALRVGRPVWESDDTFDIRAHVHHVALPAPGDEAALRDVTSDIISTPIDFSLPPWQLHVIDGYQGGCVLLSRIHHCVADGIALMGLMFDLTDETSAGWSDSPVHTATHPDAHWYSGFASVLDGISHPLAAAESAAAMASTLARLTLMPMDATTSLKGELSSTKRTAWSVPVPLDDVKAAAHRLEATVNDVVVAAVAGGLDRYLRAQGDWTGDDIRATIPVNLRDGHESADLGNRFGLVFLDIPLAAKTPLARLAAIKARMNAIKRSPEAPLSLALLGIIGTLPGSLQPAAVDFFGSKASLVLSNVPGPRSRRYIAGAEVRHVMFWGPESGHLGLGLGVLSYGGEVLFGAVSDAGLVPQPELLVAAISAALSELLKLRPLARRRRTAGAAAS